MLKLPLQSLFQHNRPLLVSSKRYQRTPFALNRTPTGLPKRDFKDRNRSILDRFKNMRLELAEPATGKPSQFKISPKEPDPVIKRTERKLPPLHEAKHQYQDYSKEDIAAIENFETYYDPLFNPHLHEEKNKVNPEEEPFSAIYSDNKSSADTEYTETRNITTPELWNYVESLARIKIAPKPNTRKANEPITALPSGFVPPPETPPDLPYFIPRTRNYLLPVYYKLDSDPAKCYTAVRQITGDLWKLEEDLRIHLESLSDSRRRIITSVRETDGTISFRGRYLHQVVDWLHSKGF